MPEAPEAILEIEEQALCRRARLQGVQSVWAGLPGAGQLQLVVSLPPLRILRRDVVVLWQAQQGRTRLQVLQAPVEGRGRNRRVRPKRAGSLAAKVLVLQADGPHSGGVRAGPQSADSQEVVHTN